MNIDKMEKKLSEESEKRPTCPHCASGALMWKDGIVAIKYQRFCCSHCKIRIRVNLENGEMSRIHFYGKRIPLTQKRIIVQNYLKSGCSPSFLEMVGLKRRHIRQWIDELGDASSSKSIQVNR